ncbi:hypothetical protein FB45DRAFT_874724 [Roridomyces roridus]|uniref:Uncharacterized protein n=1 Tax=Roridomyces roridus TaxID=1738132 RepID=A0AAD7B7U6_9AGAR|nr:hypothetical protein FB45DRAFT_874724 [Roridomyces roridus]
MFTFLRLLGLSSVFLLVHVPPGLNKITEFGEDKPGVSEEGGFEAMSGRCETVIVVRVRAVPSGAVSSVRSHIVFSQRYQSLRYLQEPEAHRASNAELLSCGITSLFLADDDENKTNEAEMNKHSDVQIVDDWVTHDWDVFKRGI